MCQNYSQTILTLFIAGTSFLSATEYSVENANQLEALPRLQAGDSVILLSGNYENVDVTLDLNGTAAEPILIYADPAGGAKFTGGTNLILDGQYATIAGLDFNQNGGPTEKEGIVKFEQNSANITLHNCQFKDFDTEAVADANWVFVEGYNNKITYCSFEGKTSLNATIFIKPTENGDEEVARNHQIKYCYFGPRTEIGNNGYESIRISDSNRQAYETKCLVAYNYFFQAISADNASEMEVISNKSRGNIYRGNILEDCDGQITIRHGRDCIVEDNYIIGTEGTRQSGIRIVGTGHIVRNNYIENVNGDGLRSALCIMDGVYDRTDNQYEGVENALIEGNVIVNCKVSANFGESQNGNDPPINSTFSNNKIYNINNRALFEIQDDVTFLTVTGNELYTNASSYGDNSKLAGGFEINQNLDLALPFEPVLQPNIVDNQTGHDFSQIFITEPLIAETLTPIDIIRGENSSTLLTEGNQGSYLNTYVSPDLKTWNLYQDPVLITTTTGIQSIEIEHSELLSQNLVTDLDKVFYQIVLDSESHTEENPPFVISPPTGDIFTESNGEVVIEAENYTSLTNRTDNSPWSASTENGIRFMEAGSGAISTWENGSELSYTVQFNTPGTYYFHPRFIANSGSSNSCFLGVNGTLLGTVNTEVSATWIWDNDETEELIIPTAGQYQIQIRKREAGLSIDQFILTNNPNANF